MLGKVPTDILKKLSDSTNDSEKFAHLLLLTKAVKPDSMTPEFGELLAKSVNISFVCRLVVVDEDKENAALYKTIGVQIIATCFLQDRFISHLEKYLPTFLEMIDDIEEEGAESLQQILDYLTATIPDKLLLEVVNLGRYSPYLWKSATLCTLDPPVNKLRDHLEALVNRIELVKPLSVEGNVSLVHDVIHVLETFPTITLRKKCSDRLLNAVEGLLKSRIPSRERYKVLSKGQYLTEKFPKSNVTPLLFYLSGIELKIQLDMMVEQGSHETTEGCTEVQLVALALTIGNCISHLAKLEEAGEAVWRQISDLRTTMESVALYLQTITTRTPLTVHLFSIYLSWLADDEAEHTIPTLISLSDYLLAVWEGAAHKEFHYFCLSYSISRGLVNQLAKAEFRCFIMDSFGGVLLRMAFCEYEAGIPISLLPVFDELVSLQLYCIIPSEVDTVKLFLDPPNLATIRYCCFLLLCHEKYSTTPPSFSAQNWLGATVDYLLECQSPSDLWLCAVRTVAETLERCPQDFDHINVEGLLGASLTHGEVQLVALALTIGNCISHLAKLEEAGEAVWRQISDLRTTMESVALYLQTITTRTPLTVHLFSIYLSWLADDEAEHTIPTLISLSDYLLAVWEGAAHKEFHYFCLSYSISRGLVNQLAKAEFRCFIMDSFGGVLLRMAFCEYEAGIPISLLPVFDELVSLQLYCIIPSEVDTVKLFLDPPNLATIRSCCFLLLCHEKYSTTPPSFSAQNWLGATVDYLLECQSPSDLWLCSVRTVAETLERCPQDFDHINVEGLLGASLTHGGQDCSELLEILEELTIGTELEQN
eukprot:sb/3462128/